MREAQCGPLLRGLYQRRSHGQRPVPGAGLIRFQFSIDRNVGGHPP